MAIPMNSKKPGVKRQGGFMGQPASDSESSGVLIAPARNESQAPGASAEAGAPMAPQEEAEAAARGAAEAGSWSRPSEARAKSKQAKGFGVRLPGLEEDFEQLRLAVRDQLAVGSVRVVLAGAVAGLIAMGEEDLQAVEDSVRNEMARRKRRKRARAEGESPDYKAHLYAVRLGVVQSEFEKLQLALEERSGDLDTSNQVMIAAAVSAYLPATAERVQDLAAMVRLVVAREEDVARAKRAAQAT